MCTGQDRAGVEEVNCTVPRETETIAAAIADAGSGQQRTLTTVRLLDFGSGNGRCFAACRAAARAQGVALDVTAYDVSQGALLAFRQALLDDGGFTVDGGGPLGDVVAGADRVRFVLGRATAPPEALRSLGSFDVALSGWGTTSATVWKSSSELDYLRVVAEAFVNLHAIELPQLRGQRRIYGVESPRYRATGTSGRWRGASEI